MVIAVTGASGFIGMHLTKYLKAKKYKIVKITRRKKHNLLSIKSLKTVPSFDLLIHLAAVTPSSENKKNLNIQNINKKLCKNAFKLAKQNHARFLYVGSYCYGIPKYLPIDEKHPIQNLNPYSQSKYICETQVLRWAKQCKLESCSLRVFNLYGPGQSEAFLIGKIIHHSKKDQLIELMQSNARRDFLHINDFCNLVEKLLKKKWISESIFNVGSGQSYSVKEIIKKISYLRKKALQVIFKETYPADYIDETKADIAKIFKFCDWKPRMSLDDGLRLWIKSEARRY